MKSTRFIGALLAAIVLVLALAACDSGSGGGGTTSKSNADLLKDAAANMKAAKSYHMELNATQAGTNVTMKGDIDVANNKSKLDMSAAGQSISATTIGSDSYLSTDGGKTFTKTDAASSPVSGLATFTSMWNSFNAADIDKAKDALKDGNPKDEKVGSDDTRHITGNAKDLSALAASGGSSTADGTIDLWITTGSTPTVRKMMISGTSSDTPVNATIEWTNVNGAVTIDAPAMP